jgi:3-oxoacyl-[acyl-carrier protein] reductase
MAERFGGRTAIVTGGASGIAARLAAEGARLGLWDCNAAALVRSGTPHTGALDGTDATAVQHAAEVTAAALGKIDIRAASVGITGPNHTVWDYPIADWYHVIDVNLTGVFYRNRAVVPCMQRHGYGRIVNIASIAGKEAIRMHLRIRRPRPM